MDTATLLILFGLIVFCGLPVAWWAFNYGNDKFKPKD